MVRVSINNLITQQRSWETGTHSMSSKPQEHDNDHKKKEEKRDNNKRIKQNGLQRSVLGLSWNKARWVLNTKSNNTKAQEKSSNAEKEKCRERNKFTSRTNERRCHLHYVLGLQRISGFRLPPLVLLLRLGFRGSFAAARSACLRRKETHTYTKTSLNVYNKKKRASRMGCAPVGGDQTLNWETKGDYFNCSIFMSLLEYLLDGMFLFHTNFQITAQQDLLSCFVTCLWRWEC